MKLVSFLFIFLFINGCEPFAAGSYVNREEYTLNYTENKVIKATELLKIENPDFVVPKVTINGLNETYIEDHWTRDSNWFVVYFYYKKENQIIYTLVRKDIDNEKITQFSLVSLYNGLDLGKNKHKDINRDFDIEENDKQLRKFERRILNKLENILKRKNFDKTQ